MDVLGADRDGRIRLGERLADRREADERRADDPDHARHPRPAAIVRASSPASAGVVCIFQFAATMTSRMAPNHARAATRRRRRPGRVEPRCRRPGVGEPLDPLERALDGGPVDLEAVGQLGQARLGRLAARRRRRAGRPAADGRAGRRPRAWSIASSWRPAAPTARWRFADSALRTRFSSPRSARDTCRASTSRSAPAGADPAQERPDRLAVLRGHDTPTAAHPPRRRQAESASRAARIGRLVGMRRRTRGASARRRG